MAIKTQPGITVHRTTVPTSHYTRFKIVAEQKGETRAQAVEIAMSLYADNWPPKSHCFDGWERMDDVSTVQLVAGVRSEVRDSFLRNSKLRGHTLRYATCMAIKMYLDLHQDNMT